MRKFNRSRIFVFAWLLACSVFLFCNPVAAQETSLQSKGKEYICSLSADEASLENILLSRADGKKTFRKRQLTYAFLRRFFKKIRRQIKRFSGLRDVSDRYARLFKKAKNKRNRVKRFLALFDDCLSAFQSEAGSCSDSSFESVQTILNTHCMSCHRIGETSPVGAFEVDNEAWFIANNLITPGDHTQSDLYRRLRDNPEDIGQQNMPFYGEPLSQDDIATIRCWINSLPGGEGGGGDPAEFFCEDDQDPAPMPLMRLSLEQYKNAILQVLSDLSSLSGDYLTIRSKVEAEFLNLPPDVVSKAFLEERDFPNNSNAIPQTLLDGMYRIAVLIGHEINSTAARRIEFVGCDLTDENASDSCKSNWIESFGQKAFRRPLKAAERTRFLEVLNTRPANYRLQDTIALFLLQPEFLYHVETEGTPVAGKESLYELTAYEKAARLSFALWQEPPSDELYRAAADGTLDSDSGYRATVDEMFSSMDATKTRNMIHSFWWNHLELDNVPPIDAGDTASFETFSAPLDIPAGGEDLLLAMKQEILDLVDHHTWDNPGNFRDLMKSTASTTDNAVLASIYGVSPTEENGPVQTLAHPRSLLERGAMLVSGSWRNLPVGRGGGFYREWLCNPLSPPPPEIENEAMIPQPDPQASTRQTYTTITSSEVCMACHSKINPLGFALEQYDSLGRRRSAENIFDEFGAVLATHQIDTAVNAEFMPGVTAEVQGPEQLLDAALETGKMDACLSQQYFRYVHRRREDLLKDGCALEQMRQSLIKEGGSLADFFKEIVLTELFQLKKAGL